MGFNLAMLGVVLREKYFPNSSCLEANKQNKSSWGWKWVLLGRQVLNRGLRWRVGNGESIRIASDPWISKPHFFKPRLQNEAPNLKVCELISDDRKQWKMEEVANLVVTEDLDLIQTILISRSGCLDKRIWHYMKNERYSVRSGYHVVMEMMKNGEFRRKCGGMPSSLGVKGGTWKCIWALMVPNKIRFFIWKLVGMQWQ